MCKDCYKTLRLSKTGKAIYNLMEELALKLCHYSGNSGFFSELGGPITMFFFQGLQEVGSLALMCGNHWK
jgi:hypothetical protein